MKYTIELTNKQKDTFECLLAITNRFIGFNPKLEPIKTTNIEDTNEYQIGYKAGLEDGYKHQQEEWENELSKHKQDGYDTGYTQGIADYRKFVRTFESGTDLFEDIRNTDGTLSLDMILQYLPMREIMARIKVYEEKKKEEIKVGDEVITLDKNIAVVTRVKDNCVRVMFKDGSGFREQHTINELKKTGRHFEEVEQLLDKLRGEG